MKLKTIWKYLLNVTDGDQELQLPVGAKIFSVDSQRGILCIWALVDPDEDLEKRVFRVHGTGHPIADSEKLKFLGTCVVLNDSLVWHIFEVKQD